MSPLRRLDLYVLKEVLPFFGLGLSLYTFALFTTRLFDLMDLLIYKGTALGVVINLLSYMLPEILSLAIPMSLLLGVLLGMNRLSMDSEYLALRSLGISLGRLLRPVLILAALLFCCNIYLTFSVVPRANYSFTTKYLEIAFVSTEKEMAPRTFHTTLPSLTLYFQDRTEDQKWNRLFLYDTAEAKKNRLLLAERADYYLNKEEKQAYLRLYNGMLHLYDLDDPSRYSTYQFSYLIQPLPTDLIFPQAVMQKRRSQQGMDELTRNLTNKAYRQNRRALLCEWNRRLSLPFANFIFALLGLGLGLAVRKGGFSLSLVVVIVYYTLFSWGENFALDGYLSPWFGLWASNVLFFAIGLTIIIRGHKISGSGRGEGLKRGEKKERSSFQEPRKVLKLRFPEVRFRFPNILDRYLIRLFLKVFLLVFLSLLTIFLIVTFFELIDDILENQKPVSLLLKYLWYYFPQIFFYILPVSGLTTTLVTLGFLSKSNEVTALKALGMNLHRFTFTLLLLGVLISGVSFGLQERVLPQSNIKATELRNRILDNRPPSHFPLQHWLSGQEDLFYRFTFFDEEKSLFKDLQLFFLSPAGNSLKRRIQAKEAVYKEGTILLKDGWEVLFDEGSFRLFRSFKTLSLSVSETQGFFSTAPPDPESMNLFQLRSYISFLEKNRLQSRTYKVEAAFKVAFPLVNFIMILFGIPFALKVGRSGTLGGIGFSILLSLVYWLMVGAFRSLGNAGVLSPFIAAMGANILFLSLALFLFSRVKR